MRQPPRVATWLLDNFRYGPLSDSLVGDLIEQFRQGRSRYWYYRQVAVALAAGMVKGVREHKFRALAGLSAGCCILYAYGVLSFITSRYILIKLDPDLPMGRYLFSSVFPRTWLLHYNWFFVIFSELIAGLLACLFGAFSGWIISRISRGVRGPVVLLFAALVFAYAHAWFIYAIASYGVKISVTHPYRDVFRLIGFHGSTIIAIVSILLGGGLFQSRRENVESGS